MAAPVLSRPSTLVRAPSTELTYTTAELSIQAQCSPFSGTLPTWYGVQVLSRWMPCSALYCSLAMISSCSACGSPCTCQCLVSIGPMSW